MRVSTILVSLRECSQATGYQYIGIVSEYAHNYEKVYVGMQFKDKRGRKFWV